MTTNVTGTTYTMEIAVTDKEAEFLHREIHKIYKALKDETNFDDLYTEKDWKVRSERLDVLRNMRNAFANLVNTHYMGEDA